jgi:peptidyl-prolyl cis-trans isomerase SurA
MIIRIGIIRFLQIIGCITIILLAVPVSAQTQEKVGIAAIVNDNIISNVDLQERVKIAMFASNIPRDKGVEAKLIPQILNNLIDEKLYMREASNLGVSVSQSEMVRVVDDLEKRNGIQPGKFAAFLQSNGISYNAMMEQIKAQLTWNQVIARKVRPQISVTSKEVDEKLEYISKQQDKEEVDISEILLIADTTQDSQKVKDAADKLVKQLRSGGDFYKIAKQFSKAASAESGGSVGWLQASQLPKDISKVIKSLDIGEVSDAIQIPGGYTILKLNDKRDLEAEDKLLIALRRALIPIEQNSTVGDINDVQDKIKKKADEIKTCDAFASFAKDIGSKVNSQIDVVKISALSSKVIKIVEALKVDEISKPIKMADGINIFMVCKKPDSSSVIALSNKVREGLIRRKLEIQASRYLRKLRNGAFIEIRI